MRLILLTILLTISTSVTIVRMQERGFISHLNKFYLYVKFDGVIDRLLVDYKLTLFIQNTICNNQVKLYSVQQIAVLECQFGRSYQKPTLTLQFQNQTQQNYIEKDKYFHTIRNLHFITQQSLVIKYWSLMQMISQWIGYFLLFLFLINFLTYLLPLLRIIQLTSVFLILNIYKPKTLDTVLYGVFYLNKYRLYQVSLQTPFVPAMEPQENTILNQLQISPVFIGTQYSSMMQQCFLMLGIFALYAFASLILYFCKNVCIVKYFIKRFVKDIFVNTACLYFIMHIPMGLTALVGFKFGNHSSFSMDSLQYIVNIIGVFIFAAGPALLATLLAFFKGFKCLFIKKCYIFSSRQKRYSQAYVFVSIFKDVLFTTSVILFKKQFALVSILLIVIIQIAILVKVNVFTHKPQLGLKLFQLILLTIFILLHILLYLFQQLTQARLPFSIGVNQMDIIGYVSIGVLGGIYFLQIVQTIIQIVLDHIDKCKINKNQEHKIQNLYDQKTFVGNDAIDNTKPKGLLSVRKERQKIEIARLSNVKIDYNNPYGYPQKYDNNSLKPISRDHALNKITRLSASRKKQITNQKINQERAHETYKDMNEQNGQTNKSLRQPQKSHKFFRMNTCQNKQTFEDDSLSMQRPVTGVKQQKLKKIRRKRHNDPSPMPIQPLNLTNTKTESDDINFEQENQTSFRKQDISSRHPYDEDSNLRKKKQVRKLLTKYKRKGISSQN